MGWKGGGWEEYMDKLSGTRGEKLPLSRGKPQSKNREIERLEIERLEIRD